MTRSPTFSEPALSNKCTGRATSPYVGSPYVGAMAEWKNKPFLRGILVKTRCAASTAAGSPVLQASKDIKPTLAAPYLSFEEQKLVRMPANSIPGRSA